jgi:hypothetical protein
MRCNQCHVGAIANYSLREEALMGIAVLCRC